MGDTCTIDRTHYQLPQYADPFDATFDATVKARQDDADEFYSELLDDLDRLRPRDESGRVPAARRAAHALLRPLQSGYRKPAAATTAT